MAMVNVVTVAADLLAQTDRLGPKVGGHLALRATFIRWTGWTLAVAVRWQHRKHRRGYYYYYYFSQ